MADNPNTEESIVNDGIPVLHMTVSPSDVIQAPVDATLSISGEAADAKVTGDAIADLTQDISDLNTSVTDIEGWTGEDIPVSTTDPTSIADAIANLSEAVLANAYPIGSIYMSINDEAPSFGGTWEEIIITHTLAQLKSGGSTYASGTPTTGTVHYWLRTA